MQSFVWYRYWPVIGLLVGLRLLFWGLAFPNPDEAYYWLWGQHLDGSYFDHPPFHAWVQGLLAAALGRSQWVLRFPNLVTTGLLFWLYWRICHHLYGRQGQDAFWLTVLLTLTSPLFFLFLALAWHDHWLIWFSTAASYCLIQFLGGDRQAAYPWLYGAGLFIGLAGLCKYLALLPGIAFLVLIASDRRWRPYFRDIHLYGAMAVALLVLLPVFGWNAQHEFASFQFYLGRSLSAADTGLQGWGPLQFLGLSFLMFGPIHSGMALQALWRPQTTPWGATYQRLAGLLLGISSGLLALLSLRAPVLYYWNLLAYPLLLPLLAGLCLHPYHRPGVRCRRGLQGAMALGCLVATLLVVHFTALPLSALVTTAGDEDTRMVYGWPTLAEVVQQEAAAFSAAPLLLTTDYRSAAALAYVLNDPSVMAISGRIDQFDFWYQPAAMQGRDAILLGDRWHPICPAHQALFARTDPPQTVAIRRWGRWIKDYTVMRGYGFQATGAAADPRSPDYPLAFTSDGETCTPQ